MSHRATSDSGVCLRDSSSASFSSGNCSKASSMCWMVLEIVGWDTSKRSAKSSSVRLWRRGRRVILRAWFRLRARGLVAGLFQVRGVNCAWVSGGCTLVLQRSFPVWFENITGVLSSFFPLVGPSHAKPSWPAHITLQDSTTYTSDTTQRILRNY